MAKHLQILRNQTINSDRNSAKTALLTQLATLNDGEIAINRYQDGTQVKVLIGFNNTIGTGTKAYVFDADNVPADVQEALNTLNGDETTEGSVKKTVKDAVEALDVDAIGGTGKYIKSVSEEDGKVSAVAEDLTSSVVTRTATEATDDKVAVDGTNVEEAIASLATSIMEAKKGAATYSVAKVTEGLASNVREAYQLVQTVNSTSTNVGEKILIYKDTSLKKVELVDEKPATDTEAAVKGQFLKFTYIIEDGSDDVVYLDCSKFLVESEFKNGLEVSTEGEVSVKVDSTSEGAESFLSVSESGVKISGVQDAIDKAKTVVAIAENDKHLDVAVTTDDTDGHSIYTIASVDTASATDLKNEITARKAVDGQDGDTYAATTTANYIKEATSLNDADVKLDSALKSEVDTIDAYVGKTDIPEGKTVMGVIVENEQTAADAINKIANAAGVIDSDDKIAYTAPTASGEFSTTNSIMDMLNHIDSVWNSIDCGTY